MVKISEMERRQLVESFKKIERYYDTFYETRDHDEQRLMTELMGDQITVHWGTIRELIMEAVDEN